MGGTSDAPCWRISRSVTRAESVSCVACGCSTKHTARTDRAECRLSCLASFTSFGEGQDHSVQTPGHTGGVGGASVWEAREEDRACLCQ